MTLETAKGNIRSAKRKFAECTIASQPVCFMLRHPNTTMQESGQ
jgi:hypothetical protein